MTGKQFVSTRFGTENLPQLGKYLSQPGMEQRLRRIIRVSMSKGAILPCKGLGIQYLEKWPREIIM